MKTSNKTKNVYLLLVIVVVVIAALAWYYFASFATTLQIVPDKFSYFNIDEPSVEIQLLNPKNAQSGEVLVSYSGNILELKELTTTEGVSTRELKNTVVFELSESYFDAPAPLLGTMVFESKDSGTAELSFDQEATNLMGDSGKLEVNYKDANLSIGVAGRVGDETSGASGESDQGTYQEI